MNQDKLVITNPVIGHDKWFRPVELIVNGCDVRVVTNSSCNRGLTKAFCEVFNSSL